MNTYIPSPIQKVARWMTLHQVRTRYDSSVAHLPEFKSWQAWLPYNDAFPHLGANGAPCDPRHCGYGHCQHDAIVDLVRVEKIRDWNEEAA